MICVSIANPSLEKCLRVLGKLALSPAPADAGGPLAELRLEKIKGLDEAGIRRIFAMPCRIIATCRPEGMDEEMREGILLTAINSGAAYVDIELETAPERMKKIVAAARKAGCQVIVSYHDFEHTPKPVELGKIKEKCFSLGADIAKLACLAKNKQDVEAMLGLCERKRLVVPISMGPLGREERARIVMLGSPFTYAAHEDGQATAPGQVGRERMAEMLEKLKKSGRDETDASAGTDIRLFAVAGNPILHSKSPQMHNAAYAALGMDAVYFRLLGENAREVLATARAMGLDGLNITSPFKEEMAKAADRLDGSAARLEAVNTVLFEDNKSVGHNTDPMGVAGALEKAGVEMKSQKAVVIGAGGAAKAAVLALTEAGAVVTCANRTVKKAQGMAEKFGCHFCSLEKKDIVPALKEARILVSCIGTGERIAPKEALHEKLAVLEANYSLKSALSADAREAGCRRVRALDWLLYQGMGSFEIFTGQKAPEEAMRKILEGGGGEAGEDDAAGHGRAEAKRPETRIALVGLMGSGKTSVGKVLAKRTGLALMEMDEMIEEKAGRTVREIFEQEGEDRFREMESALLLELAKKDKMVVSCGGGIVLREENIELLRKHFTVVWLFAPARTLAGRTEGDANRPLLDHPDREGKLRSILRARMPAYASACDFALDAEKKPVKKIVEMIVHEIYRAG